MNPVMEALSKGKGGSPGPDEGLGEEEVDIDVDDDLEAAGAAVARALKGGDSAAFTKALKGFVQMCGGY